MTTAQLAIQLGTAKKLRLKVMATTRLFMENQVRIMKMKHGKKIDHHTEMPYDSTGKVP